MTQAQLKTDGKDFARWMLVPVVVALLGGSAFLASMASGEEPTTNFKITVVDDDSGQPVPMVELTTLHHVRFVTDNAGLICFDLPELMGRETWFTVQGHGYSVPKDGFGYRGVRLVPQRGGEATLRLQRDIKSERVGRLTGTGLFAESQRFGLHTDWNDQGILGCDSVQSVEHQGKIHWLWGDTTLAHYPLGRFHMIGATTHLDASSLRTLPLMPRYDYVVDSIGIPRNVAEMPGEGPTWLTGLVSLPDDAGVQHLGATFLKIRPPLEPCRIGLCEWEPTTQVFQPRKVIWEKESSSLKAAELSYPHGHPVRTEDKDGNEVLLFGDPFATLKCEARWESCLDPNQWHAIEPQKNVQVQEDVVVRNKEHAIEPHRGAIAYSPYLSRWVTVFNEWNGKTDDGEPSLLGEVWFATAESPLGPWGRAVKIATHHRHSFYNPQIHRSSAGHDSRWLFYEGTFTVSFTDNDAAVPRYEYNQVLYKLDLEQFRRASN